MSSQEKYEVYDYIGESEFNKRAQPVANIRLEVLDLKRYKKI